jgi:hypothetical protein
MNAAASKSQKEILELISTLAVRSELLKQKGILQLNISKAS